MRWMLIALSLLAPLPAAATVYDFAARTEGLERFAALMRQTGIDRALSNPGPYTIFAPEDAAFAQLPSGLDRERLVQILTCHMAPSRAVTTALAQGQSASVRTVGGCRLRVTRQGDHVIVQDDAGRTHRVLTSNLMQSNGVVHVVDSLILPAY